MVKPFRALLLLGYVAGLLAVALFLLPPQVKLTKDLTFKSFTIRSIFESPKSNYADISDITAKFSEPQPDTVFVATAHAKKKEPVPGKPAPKPAPDSADARYRIQYGKSDTALYALFRSLQALSYGEKLIRVLHYGDSQLEGDRITSSLRAKLQARFGGCGVGLVPLFDPIGARNSVIVKSGYPWQKTFVYGNGYDKRNPNLYGLLGSYYTYLSSQPEGTDSLGAPGNEAFTGPTDAIGGWQNVSVTLQKSSRATERESRFERLKILYRNHQAPFEVRIRTPRDTLELRTLNRDTLAVSKVYEYRMNEPFQRVQITFGGRASPQFFGVAMRSEAHV